MAELWEVPEVSEFFNLDAMDHGKSYAERAHGTPGHGLRWVSHHRLRRLVHSSGADYVGRVGGGGVRGWDIFVWFRFWYGLDWCGFRLVWILVGVGLGWCEFGVGLVWYGFDLV